MIKPDLNVAWLNILNNSNEAQRRHLAGLRALELGWGGVTKVCELTGMSHHTIRKGMVEVKKRGGILGRIRKVGGGRKQLVKQDKKLQKDFENILEDNTAGDPMKFLRWTNKSLSTIATALQKKNHTISRYTVRRLLKIENYTLQSNKKSKEQGNQPERDAQFMYINKTIKRFTKDKQPVISVDAKKKELVGNFKNAGRIWKKKGQAEIVNVYDYELLAIGKAVPYGTYDITRNEGFVNIGISSNTAEFAVNSIKDWWKIIGNQNYPKAKELLITADCGSSNGFKNKLWKSELQKFVVQTGLTVTILHYPQGTSKWNKIEHRMFSFISMNWKGKPLTTYQIIIKLIQGTKTKEGLTIKAKIDRKTYKTGIKIKQDEMKQINIQRHKLHPDWNYTIKKLGKLI